MEMLPEPLEPVSLITINDDCKELIFEYLELEDLISIGDTSKQLYTSVCQTFRRKLHGNGKIQFGLPCSDAYVFNLKPLDDCIHLFFMLIFYNRFTKEYIYPNPVIEPDICVTNGVIALKIVRLFGHLIMNLHLDYQLFYVRKGDPHSDVKFCKFIDYYLSEFCSESLHEISLQGSFRTAKHYCFEDAHKPFVNVKKVHTERCAFGEKLPFNKVFPNLRTLKLGYNTWTHPSAIRMNFNSLENLWFYDKNYNIAQMDFKEEDIEEMLRLNPQIQNAVLLLDNSYNVWHRHSLSYSYSSDFDARLQKHYPNIHISLPRFGYHNIFSYDAFFFETDSFSSEYGRKKFTDMPEGFPIKISDKYKNSLEKLCESYWKMDSSFPYPSERKSS